MIIVFDFFSTIEKKFLGSYSFSNEVFFYSAVHSADECSETVTLVFET